MKNTVTKMEKVAMIWTFPITLIFFAALSVIALVLYAILFVLNTSGTTGACLYLIDQMRLMMIDRKLKKLVKEDEKKHNFDEL